MRKEYFTFKSKIDNLEISALIIWPEVHSPKGIIEFVHGMCEYKERYIDLMEFFAENGYACGIYDHRGHGHSVKSEEDLGYMYEGGAVGLVQDAHQFCEILKEKSPDNIPFYLYGHSMGSLVVRCFLKEYDDEIDKLVVCGSPSQRTGTGFGLALINFSIHIKGERGRWKFIDTLVTDMAFEGKFPGEGMHSWISSDSEVVKKYNQDKYCNYRFTLNAYKALISITRDTYSKKNWQLKNVKLPICFFSGEKDPCAISEEAWKKSIEFLRQIGYENVSGKMYPGMRHEIHNEIDHQKVYEDMLSFIKN